MTTEQKLDLALRALANIEDLLEDWPTMRALSALGAERATAKKMLTRSIIADTLESVKA